MLELRILVNYSHFNYSQLSIHYLLLEFPSYYNGTLHVSLPLALI